MKLNLSFFLPILILVFVFTPAKLLSQEIHPSADVVADTISFRLTAYNNMVLHAVLNELDTLDLMLHTAASEMTLIESVTDRLRSINYGSPDSVKSWGGSSTSRISSGNSLQIGKMLWEDILIWENKHSGQETDGKIGMDFFKSKVLEINYEENYIVVHKELPKLRTDYEEMPLELMSGMRFLKGTLSLGEESYENLFLIHSGYAGSLLLDDEFAQKYDLEKSLDIIDQQILKDSYGNELKTLKAILPGFQMGTTRFNQVPIGFFSGAIGRQKMSVMGGDLLKRFNWMFDLKEERLYVRANANVEVAYRE